MPIEQLTAWIMLIALIVYVLLGGADFGGGVWDLFAITRSGERQRRRIHEAIGPVWEANHVWLIVVIVLMFTCFPRAFAAIMTALHVPVTLMLIGIVLRGSAFTFRTYDRPGQTTSGWGLVFSWSSLLTPILLGVTLGAIAGGELRWEDHNGNLKYVGGFFSPWLKPFPFAVGLFTTAIFAYLAAVYLCVEEPTADLCESFRRRAIWSWIAVAVLGAATWITAAFDARVFFRALFGSWWSWPLVIVTAAVAFGALWAVIKRRYLLARLLAVSQVALIVLGYGMAQFPYLVIPQFTIESSAASRRMHVLVLSALAVGALILVPSLYYLLRVFKGQRAFALLDRSATDEWIEATTERK